MNQSTKKLLSLLLVVVLTFSGISAFAAESDSLALGLSGTITGFAEIGGISVDNGTTLADVQAQLPATVAATLLPDGEEAVATPTDLPVSGWLCTNEGGYNADVEAFYTFEPTLDLPEDVTVGAGVELPYMLVTVGNPQTGIIALAATQRTTTLEITSTTTPQDNVSTEGWAWDGTTLTLNGFNSSITAQMGGAGLKISTSATINLIGENTITSSSIMASPIEINENTTITGNGALTVSTSASHGILANNGCGVKLESGMVKVTTNSASHSAVRLNTGASGFEIAGGALEADGGRSGYSQSNSSTDLLAISGGTAIFKGGTKAIDLNSSNITLPTAYKYRTSDSGSYIQSTVEGLTNVVISAATYVEITEAGGGPTVPTLVSATYSGSTITLTFSEALDDTKAPFATAFTVTGYPVTGISVSETTVTLTLGSSVTSNTTVSYTPPGSGNKLQSPSGGLVAAFSNQTVSSGSTPTASATVSDYTFSGTVGTAFTSGSQINRITITLSNDRIQTSEGYVAYNGSETAGLIQNLPDGLSVSATSNLYNDDTSFILVVKGTPREVASGALSIKIPSTILAGGQDITVTINPNTKWNITGGIPATAPTIVTSTLPGGTEGTPYREELTATGTAPLTWSIDSGSLPGGLAINSSTGTISGIPNAAGTFNFTVKASNSVGNGTQDFTIVVNGSGTPTASALVSDCTFSGTVGTAFTSGSQINRITITLSNDRIQTSEGYVAYNGSETAGLIQNLPDGLSVSATSNLYNDDTSFILVVKGTPREVASGALSIKIPGTILAGGQDITVTTNPNTKWNITGGIPATAPTIVTTTLPGGTEDTPYREELTATGTAPFTWSIDSGSLPGGLAINSSTGTISGIPSAAGTFNFTVKASNSAGDSTKAFTIVISSAGPSAVNHTITAIAGIGGSISPYGNVTVSDGGSQTFTISADSNYRIYDVEVDGTSQGAISSYTFDHVTTNHTISAFFTRIGYARIPNSTDTDRNSSDRGSTGNSGSITTTVSAPNLWLEPNPAQTLSSSASDKNNDIARTKSTDTFGVRKASWNKFAQGQQYQHDTIDGKSVSVRLYINNPTAMNRDIYVTGHVTGSMVEKRKAFFEKWFVNPIRVIHMDESDPWGQPVEIAAKVDLSGMDIDNLYIYSYDKKTNTYTRVSMEKYWVDKNGYLHFYTELAGDIIISEGPLTKK